MKKLLMRLRSAQGAGETDSRSAAIVCVSFLIGALLGGVFAAYGGEAEELARRSLLPTVESVGLFDAVVTVFRYPALALFCGLAVFGVVAEPLLCGVRGFLLCFAATALFRLYGGAGLLLAAAESAVECIVSVPCFLYLAAGGLVRSAGIIACLGGRAKPGAVFSKLYALRVALIAAVLAFGVLCELYLTPLLVSAAAGLIN